MTTAAGHILTHIKSALSQQLKTIFFSTGLDFSELPYLHQIVLGIIPGDLSAELRRIKDLDELNQHDLVGKTALHWAASRQNTGAIQDLIRAGANVNAWDGWKLRTPLFEAANVRSTKCIQALLIGGADPYLMNITGGTALMLGLYSQSEQRQDWWDDVTWLESLVSNSAQLRGMTSKQYPILSYYACSVPSNPTRHVDFLINHRAEINKTDPEGDSPLFETILSNCPKYLQLLLKKGARYDQVNALGLSVLHYIAMYGELETLRIFMHTKLQGLDPGMRDRNGLTALDRLNQRAGVTEEFAQMFKVLIDKICRAKSAEDSISGMIYESDDDVETFQDALEFQE